MTTLWGCDLETVLIKTKSKSQFNNFWEIFDRGFELWLVNSFLTMITTTSHKLFLCKGQYIFIRIVLWQLWFSYTTPTSFLFLFFFRYLKTFLLSLEVKILDKDEVPLILCNESVTASYYKEAILKKHLIFFIWQLLHSDLAIYQKK